MNIIDRKIKKYRTDENPFLYDIICLGENNMEYLFNFMPNLTDQTVSLRALTIADLKGIRQMLLCKDTYRYVPPFVPELQCNGDIDYFINTMCK